MLRKKLPFQQKNDFEMPKTQSGYEVSTSM